MILDVPEVGRSETQVAFSTKEVFEGGIKRTAECPIELREYGGRLHKKVVAANQLADAAYRQAFVNEDAAKSADPCSDISGGFAGNHGNPIVSPIRRQLDWHLERGSINDSNILQAWPQGGQGTESRLRARNKAKFNEIAPHIDDLDHGLCEMSTRMIEAQADKLLVIDGDLWMACRPPSWRVTTERNRTIWRDVAVHLDLAIAIEGFDPVLSRRHFPLDRLDDARKYAALCVKKTSSDRETNYTNVERIVDYEAAMPALLSFDADGEELARIGYALSMECWRFISKGNWGYEANSLAEAIDATKETNFVLGEMGAVSPYVEDLCTAWKAFHRPSFYTEMGPDGKRFGDMMFRRAKALYENAPIDLALGDGHRLASLKP